MVLRVFDGLQINVAGAGRGSFNHRFAQPSRHAALILTYTIRRRNFPSPMRHSKTVGMDGEVGCLIAP